MNDAMAMVSVCMITYNHEKYIAQAIDGVLMQQTSFPFELIIGEDCSTDNTRKICEEYKAKYPDKIQLLLPDSNLGMKQNFISTLQACTSKYIAVCEGDDYWTDPCKLQKQVDFLEANEGYSVTFHRNTIFENEANKYRSDGCGSLFTDTSISGVTIDTEQFLKNWITQPLTMVFRRASLDISLFSKYLYFRDMHLIYHLFQNGRGYLFSFDGGVYREHSGGIHSKQSLKYQCEIGISVAKELFLNNKTDAALKENYLTTLQWGISCFAVSHYSGKKLFIYLFQHLYYSKSIKKFLKNCYLVYKKSTYSLKRQEH